LDYVNPIDYLDTSRLHEAGITACIAAQLYVVDPDLGEIFLGHVVHIVKEGRGIGSRELVTRMWLGHIDKQQQKRGGSGGWSGGGLGYYAFPPPSLVNYLANSAVYRLFGLNTSWARHQWIHTVQEMGCIANLLPIFYPVELQRLQERKEMFPNGLVIDEERNHLRNGGGAGGGGDNQMHDQVMSRLGGDTEGVGGDEYKSSDLPRPLTVFTGAGLEPWEALGAGGSSKGSLGGGSQRHSSGGSGNRNQSLRAQQLHHPPPLGDTSTPDRDVVTSSSNLQLSTPHSLNQRLGGGGGSDDDDGIDDDSDDDGKEGGGGGEGDDDSVPAGLQQLQHLQPPSSQLSQSRGDEQQGEGSGGGSVAVSYGTDELGGGVDI
jgi:hypothetical protein